MSSRPAWTALAVGAALLLARPLPAHAEEPTLENAPLQLRHMLLRDAKRAQQARLYDGAFAVVAAATTVGSGVFALPSSDDGFRTTTASAVILMGALGLGGAIYGMVVETPLERFAASYGPLALDPRIPAEERLFTGEEGLREAARLEARGRRLEGVAGIVVGVVLGSLALSLATARSFSTTERTSLTSFTAVSAFMSAGSGVGRLWFQRSSAELALEHWQTTRREWPTELAGGYTHAF